MTHSGGSVIYLISILLPAGFIRTMTSSLSGGGDDAPSTSALIKVNVNPYQSRIMALGF